MISFNLKNQKERKKFITELVKGLVDNSNGEFELLFDNEGITKIIITFDR